jgi:MerR family transcriptional regulator, thiopeptide resistance regulator
MWTVSKLARRCGLSRGTLLYYESIGLLKPPAAAPPTTGVTASGIAALAADLRLSPCRADAGTISAILIKLDRRESDAAAVLKRRLVALDGEIETRRAHQRAILKLLQNDSIGRKK